MKLAIEGCAHGDLEIIYESLTNIEQKQNIKIDLLIICGDFQAVRNKADLQTMAVPDKFLDMKTFHKYYSGEKVAPILTIFIGGNHEASNHMKELTYGGWAAPNIYYLGNAGVVDYNGVKIGGISGIYKENDYHRGHFECFPFNENTKRSIYHVRNLEVFRLSLLKKPVDVFVSHDWPRGIHNHGDVNKLLKKKVFLKEDIDKQVLGSPASETLLKCLRPNYWFAAHLHCKFVAVVKHEEMDSKKESHTKFLALDKCLPRRQFLQVIDIQNGTNNTTGEAAKLTYDLEWLTILKNTDHLLSVEHKKKYMPSHPGSVPIKYSEEDVLKCFSNDLTVPLNFVRTVPTFREQNDSYTYRARPNPQMIEFCTKLKITDPLKLLCPSSEDFPSENVDSANTSIMSTWSELNSDTSMLDKSRLDETIEEEFGFVIDKKGMSQQQLDLKLTDSSFTLPNLPLNSSEKESFPELKPQVKKSKIEDTRKLTFKRRNADIYQTESTDI